MIDQFIFQSQIFTQTDKNQTERLKMSQLHYNLRQSSLQYRQNPERPLIMGSSQQQFDIECTECQLKQKYQIGINARCVLHQYELSNKQSQIAVIDEDLSIFDSIMINLEESEALLAKFLNVAHVDDDYKSQQIATTECLQDEANTMRQKQPLPQQIEEIQHIVKRIKNLIFQQQFSEIRVEDAVDVDVEDCYSSSACHSDLKPLEKDQALLFSDEKCSKARMSYNKPKPQKPQCLSQTIHFMDSQGVYQIIMDWVEHYASHIQNIIYRLNQNSLGQALGQEAGNGYAQSIQTFSVINNALPFEKNTQMLAFKQKIDNIYYEVKTCIQERESNLKEKIDQLNYICQMKESSSQWLQKSASSKGISSNNIQSPTNSYTSEFPPFQSSRKYQNATKVNTSTQKKRMPSRSVSKKKMYIKLKECSQNQENQNSSKNSSKVKSKTKGYPTSTSKSSYIENTKISNNNQITANTLDNFSQILQQSNLQFHTEDLLSRCQDLTKILWLQARQLEDNIETIAMYNVPFSSQSSSLLLQQTPQKQKIKE